MISCGIQIFISKQINWLVHRNLTQFWVLFLFINSGYNLYWGACFLRNIQLPIFGIMLNMFRDSCDSNTRPLFGNPAEYRHSKLYSSGHFRAQVSIDFVNICFCERHEIEKKNRISLVVYKCKYSVKLNSSFDYSVLLFLYQEILTKLLFILKIYGGTVLMRSLFCSFSLQ